MNDSINTSQRYTKFLSLIRYHYSDRSIRRTANRMRETKTRKNQLHSANNSPTSHLHNHLTPPQYQPPAPFAPVTTNLAPSTSSCTRDSTTEPDIASPSALALRLGSLGRSGDGLGVGGWGLEGRECGVWIRWEEGSDWMGGGGLVAGSGGAWEEGTAARLRAVIEDWGFAGCRIVGWTCRDR